MKNKDNLYHDHSMWKGAKPDTFSKARGLRNQMTEPEKVLWQKLNNTPYRKFKFRRQHPLGHYILDFYSHSLKLAIEIDGPYHLSSTQKEHDKRRTEFILFQEIKELRFTNKEVLNNISDVLRVINLHIEKHSPDSL